MAQIINYGKSVYSMSSDEKASAAAAIQTALKNIDSKFSVSNTVTTIDTGFAVSYDGTVIGEVGFKSGTTYAERKFNFAADSSNVFAKNFSANADYCFGVIYTAKAVALVDFSDSAGGIVAAAVIFTVDSNGDPVVCWNPMSANDNTFQETAVYSKNSSGSHSSLPASVTHVYSDNCSAFNVPVYLAQSYVPSVYWMICNPLTNGTYRDSSLDSKRYVVVGSFLIEE